MIGRLNHVAIVVPDIEAAANLYRNTFGATVSAAKDQPAHGVTTVFVRLDNTAIELLHPLGVPADRIHAMYRDGDLPDEAAVRYGALLRELVPPGDFGIPSLDLAIQGVGTDGHTASIFPDQLGSMDRQEGLCYVARHPETGQLRITMSAAQLRAADHLWFLVSGKAKAGIVAEILGEPAAAAHRYPAAAFPASEWFMDQTAGALIN